MGISTELLNRSKQTCELCSNHDNDLKAYTVPPKTDEVSENQAVLCSKCFEQIAAGDYTDIYHWRCLEGSIWSDVPAVQVLSYKILSKLILEEWARDTMEGAYLNESLVEWANGEDEIAAQQIIHKDSYGTLLASGDTIVLIENLNVKGTNYIAPKGTIVRKIKLVQNNAEQVEGKINGDTIIILTKFIRKLV